MNRRGRLAVGVAGVLLILYSALLLIFLSYNSGFSMLLLFGLLLVTLAAIFDSIPQKLSLWLKRLLVFGSAAAVLLMSFLTVFGSRDTASYDEDAVIVLGSGVHGRYVTENLKGRLDRALEYCDKNPDAVIVLSGGAGKQEEIPESAAMERYMLEHGIPKERLLTESAATSTRENFLFSRAALDGRFGSSDYKICFVTNGYHVLRAGCFAEEAGFSGATHCHSGTAWYTALPNTLRECFALARLALLGY